MAGRHSRRRGARAGIPEQRSGSGRHRSVRITDARTDLEHLVLDEVAAEHRHSGRYLAVCGTRVLAAAMVAPAGRPCQPCRRVVVVARGQV